MINKKHPLSLEEFLDLYYKHLAAPDRPTAFIAYCRAESDVWNDHKIRRFANHKSFRNVMSRYLIRSRQKADQ